MLRARRSLVLGGSAGMGREIAIDVVDHDGSVATVGRSKARADSAAAERTAHGTETTTRRQRTANRAGKGTSK
jgi:short-subunit dehydrogenase